MSDSTQGLRRQIGSAMDLQSVVRTMKSLAASKIGQYQAAVRALADYYRTVELGLGVCCRQTMPTSPTGTRPERGDPARVGAVVFGSDQGLVGRFNDVVVDFALERLAALPGGAQVWAVGERVYARLTDAGLPPAGRFPVPTGVKAITSLVGQIQVASEARRAQGGYAQLWVFHNRPLAGALYEPSGQRLLPLDDAWRQDRAAIPWPGRSRPEVLGPGAETFGALLREYLFISLFRACAESLASENASRLAAMQRADQNIDQLLEGLHGTFRRLRQSTIDEELFDVISGFETLSAASATTA
jgi:F-type H+-transporting ATPase subunit gamma